MSSTYREKTAWVTGASSGIGEALAVALADSGAQVILSARRRDELDRVRLRCAHPQRHTVLPLDLAETETLTDLARRVWTEHGPVDLIFHCGGIGQRAQALDTQLQVDRRVMDVNYFGTVALTKALVPLMLERGQGHVVPISSLVGKFGTPLRSGYAASKHALHGFFDALRAECHGRGVHFTVVCPGFVRTNFSRHALIGDGRPQDSVDRAHRRGMDPEVCARRILRAVADRRSEVYIGGSEVLGVYLKRLWPSLFDWLVRRVRVT